jgi:hypothetical protein
MKVAYFDSRARPNDDRLNWTDLVMWWPDFCWVDTGDVLLGLAPSGDGYVVERRLAVVSAEEGGDSLDVYCERAPLVGATTIARGDARLGDFWPAPRVHAVEVPEAVATAMGVRA